MGGQSRMHQRTIIIPEYFGDPVFYNYVAFCGIGKKLNFVNRLSKQNNTFVCGLSQYAFGTNRYVQVIIHRH